jgi:hypothetical protein
MRIITHVLAVEVKLCLVVSTSQADFESAQRSKDEARDAEAHDRAKCSELQSAFRVPEFSRPRARALTSRRESRQYFPS